MIYECVTGESWGDQSQSGAVRIQLRDDRTLEEMIGTEGDFVFTQMREMTQAKTGTRWGPWRHGCCQKINLARAWLEEDDHGRKFKVIKNEQPETPAPPAHAEAAA